jgi:molybdate transport system ATP-binding protein
MTQYVEVRLRNVRLVRSERVVLRSVDWHIRAGERWVLAGGNGAGKTQLLKLIAGSVWPTPPAGPRTRTYRWRNETFATPREVQDEIGYVGPERQDKYERYGWSLTVEQIVGTGLYRTDIALNALSARDRRRIASVLRRLGIEGLAQRRFLTLSYGERRLALLARTLASRPRLLLLDELLNGLDETNRARALRWLQHTTRSLLPWVLTTHRVEDVPAGVTHALVLEGGRVVHRSKVRAGARAASASLGRWLHADHDRPRADAGGRRARPDRARHLRQRQRQRRVPTRSGRPLVRLVNAAVYLEDAQALQGISLEVHKGECWVVHGGNGSGKTTLLRTLYGDHGVAFGGRVERAGIEPGVPLQVFASRTLVELSYGQLRRVLFARAWVRRPQLLLLDEAFAGVDGPTRRELLAHVHQAIEGGTAVIMATHHRAEWPVLTTHELELASGRARYCGPVRSARRGHGVSAK